MGPQGLLRVPFPTTATKPGHGTGSLLRETTGIIEIAIIVVSVISIRLVILQDVSGRCSSLCLCFAPTTEKTLKGKKERASSNSHIPPNPEGEVIGGLTKLGRISSLSSVR
ncbi:hypothetical protein RRF57_005727 [Xylaria bambusicola]|uniref:Uncharacterized protein n=1 Tax=Xylaria bambusicola TaxID=326684 RepID=A0AAN7UK82_9PEZI